MGSDEITRQVTLNVEVFLLCHGDLFVESVDEWEVDIEITGGEYLVEIGEVSRARHLCERLLSFAEATRFIFSHSALREGWDNPNVFVMCMLKHNESQNTISRRQEVGRGLRIATRNGV